MKSKFFTVALATVIVAIACAVAGASPPHHQARIAVVAATADNIAANSALHGTLGVTAGPIMTSHPNAMGFAVTRTDARTDFDNGQQVTTPTIEIGATTYASAVNPTRDPEPEVVDLRRQNQTPASTTYSYGLERGARPVVNHPLRS